MNTTTAGNHPDNMPVWARLALAAQGIDFTRVEGWEDESDTQICAHLTPYGYALLHRR